eukprot:GEMP01031009.1.p1 GENE.GEMP01031009.1~~GEMP01031009.1.p1  ORF type:complete len:442 (+),score=69.54 GEMP01031009.1:70-1395(+)
MKYMFFTIVFAEVAAPVNTTAACTCEEGSTCQDTWGSKQWTPWCHVDDDSSCGHKEKYDGRSWSTDPCKDPTPSHQAPRGATTESSTNTPERATRTIATCKEGLLCQDHWDELPMKPWCYVDNDGSWGSFRYRGSSYWSIVACMDPPVLPEECKCKEDYTCQTTWEGKKMSPWCYVDVRSSCRHTRWFHGTQRTWSKDPCSAQTLRHTTGGGFLEEGAANQKLNESSSLCECKQGTTCSTIWKGKTIEAWCSVEEDSGCEDTTTFLAPGKSSFDACNHQQPVQACDCIESSYCDPIWRGVHIRHWCWVERRSSCNSERWWTDSVPGWWSYDACQKSATWIGPTTITSCVLLGIVILTAMIALCPRLCRSRLIPETKKHSRPQPKRDALVANICEAYGLERGIVVRPIATFTPAQEEVLPEPAEDASNNISDTQIIEPDKMV